MWWWRERVDGAEFGFTDRHGGVSEGGFATLNLGGHTGDAPGRVTENRARVAAALGAGPLTLVRQVHGATVHLADDPRHEPRPEADAIVTRTPGRAIAVMVADCVPLVLLAPGAVAVVHAGRVGLARGVVEAAITALDGLADGPVQAVIGPRVCGRCYEVPPEMAEAIAAAYPATRATTRAGTTAVDLGAGVRQAAEALGVTVRDQGAGTCTMESPDLFSHRASGPATGRSVGVAVLR